MKSSSELKNRIKSIKDTAQITKAMQLISVMKMRKAIAKFDSNKRYNELLKKTISDIFSVKFESSNRYTVKREGNRIAYIVISSDKGLAGDYNNKVLELAYNDMKYADEVYVYALGHIGADYFKTCGFETNTDFVHIMDNPNTYYARHLMYEIMDLYNQDIIDEARIAFTSMVSLSNNKPIVKKLLPLSSKDYYIKETLPTEENPIEILEFNGNYNDVIESVVEQFILGIIYSALIQSEVAEHYQRMMAMDSATRNGEEMLEKLSLEFNKVRQEKITTEILETSVAMLRKE